MTSYVIDYFELPTAETARSRAFFGEAFGWTFNEYGPGYSEFADAGLVGGLNGDADDRSAATVIGIRTDDIESALAAVERAGGTISVQPYDFPGGRRFFFREPGGAELMVYRSSE